MNRGARRLPIFGDDDDRTFFLDCVGGGVGRSMARVHAYVLMDNHYHLLVEAAADDLATTMKYVGENYTRRFNAKYGLDGPLFRGRYRSKPILDERQRTVVLRYIHRNPAEVGLGLSHPWSSHAAYVAASAPRPQWLIVDELLGTFATRAAYGRFIAMVDDDRVLEDFIEAGTAVRVVTPDAVDWALGIDSAAELQLVRTSPLRADRRLAAVLLSHEATNRPSTALASRYGYRSGSGLRSAAARARARVGADPTFAALVADARRRLAGVVADVA